MSLHDTVINKYGYKVPTSSTQWSRQVRWLFENLGHQGGRWDYSQTHFYFLDEQDKILFLLRWS